MPELPEVETIKSALSDALTFKRIKKVTLNRMKIRLDIPHDFKALCENTKIINVKRVAKYILIELDNKKTIVIHLGMSGKITICSEIIEKKHDHVIFTLDDGTFIIYNDARRFGFVSFLDKINLSKIAVDALSNDFDVKYLKEKFLKKTCFIKHTLLNQEIVAGLGNIYVIEALFKSNISPLKKACDLSFKEIEELVKNIKEILRLAIKAGGTTLKDYRKANGSLGYFQNELLVYGKEGEKCPKCSAKIQRIIQGGRSTFFCPKCQK